MHTVNAAAAAAACRHIDMDIYLYALRIPKTYLMVDRSDKKIERSEPRDLLVMSKIIDRMRCEGGG